MQCEPVGCSHHPSFCPRLLWCFPSVSWGPSRAVQVTRPEWPQSEDSPVMEPESQFFKIPGMRPWDLGKCMMQLGPGRGADVAALVRVLWWALPLTLLLYVQWEGCPLLPAWRTLQSKAHNPRKPLHGLGALATYRVGGTWKEVPPTPRPTPKLASTALRSSTQWRQVTHVLSYIFICCSHWHTLMLPLRVQP